MADAKIDFEQWLQAGNAKKLVPSFVIANIDEVSKWAVENKIIKVGFFEMADSKQFNPVRNKLLNNKFFRKNNRQLYKDFEKAGRLYFDFLKERGTARN